MADAPAWTAGNSVKFFFANYWRGVFLLVWPVLTLPIAIVWGFKPCYWCMYVITVMAGYWVTECLPLGVTALIPMVMFPVCGILDTAPTSLNYFKDTNMMFLGGVILALAVEYSNLHRRIALNMMLIIGASPRKLHLGLCVVTMFASMWLVNTAAAAMVCPIADAVMNELESQGITKMYENRGDPNFDIDKAKPTKTTNCLFLSIAFSASIGGVGTIIGTGTNLVLRGLYEKSFGEMEDKDTVNFTNWLTFGIPTMICCEILVILWMQILYLGLFRPKSADAKAVNIGKEGERIATEYLKKRRVDLGPWTYHEINVTIIFILAVLLWFFKAPQFIPGWASLFPEAKIKDATPAILVVILLFALPANLNFFKVFKKNDPDNRSGEEIGGLITWKIVHAKMYWGLILLLGGGFAMADGSKASGMSALIGNFLGELKAVPQDIVYVLIVVFVGLLTQVFSSNVAVANLILPIMADMCKAAQWHPMKTMLASTIATSFAFCLPSSTPPNAIAAAAGHIQNIQMIIAGAGAALWCMLVCIPMVLFIGDAVFHFDELPPYLTTEETT